MNAEFAWLRPKYMIPGLKLLGGMQGAHAGEFGEVQGFYAGTYHGAGAEHQYAIFYRQSRGSRRHGADVIVSWARDPGQPFIGCTNHAGVPVSVNGKEATYYDGAWAPGPGPDQIKAPANGSAHWSRDLEHSLTMRTDRGVLGLRCRRAVVSDPGELIKIMSSIETS